MTDIEWVLNADGTKGRTWNPTTGCSWATKDECENCYAMTLARRLQLMERATGRTAKYANDGLAPLSGPGFGFTEHEDALDEPLRRKKPTTWFVNSMSDLFHHEATDLFIAQVWAVMSLCPQHTFIILTKRPKSMAAVLTDEEGEFRYKMSLARKRMSAGEDLPRPVWPLPNVWLGASIGKGKYAYRGRHVVNTPAAIRLLSLEPCLGPLDDLELVETCPSCDGERLLPMPGGACSCERCFRGPLGCGESTGTVPRFDWIIVGGESGPNARPVHPEWVRDIRDRCQEAGIDFFFKQWGAWIPEGQVPAGELPKSSLLTRKWIDRNGTERYDPAGGAAVRRVGKKIAGRNLDGRVHNAMPPRGLQGATRG